MTRTMFAEMAPSEPVANIAERAIPSPGGSIPVRIYRPAGTQPLPVLVFLHGCGFVIRDLDTHDAVCRALTNRAECVTLSVDYRLAPEHQAAAAADDCYAAAKWSYGGLATNNLRRHSAKKKELPSTSGSAFSSELPRAA